MNHIEKNLYAFRATTLEDISAIKLLKRYDTKFLFHKGCLETILNYLSRHYAILEIGDSRIFSYENLYYDTDDYFFYHQHHNRKLNRYKVRCRRYVESEQCYFEVKFKNNKRKTIKSRLLLADKEINHELSEEKKAFAKNNIVINNGKIVEKIHPKLKVEYRRITFANRQNKERLTIDTSLTYTDRASGRHEINNLIIAELKSERFAPNSPFFQYLKSLNIVPVRFSKYCMGIAMTEENIKYNRFKKKLSTLKKMGGEV